MIRFITIQKGGSVRTRTSGKHTGNAAANVYAPLSGSYYFWAFATVGFWIVVHLYVLVASRNNLPYVVQDDARHFVTWLRRMSDPGIYPGDFIADQLDAIYTPWLYRAIYRPFAMLQIDPLLFHLFVVMPATGMLFSVACYNFIHRFWPCPNCAGIATIVMGYQLTWVPLGLPRSFGDALVLSLLLGFLFWRPLKTGFLMFCSTGLLPVSSAVAGLAMAFLMFRTRVPFLPREGRAWLALLASGVAALVGAQLFLSQHQGTGPYFTVQEARSVPIFSPQGRRPFFDTSEVSFFLCNGRAGMMPMCENVTGMQPEDALLWALLVSAVVGTGVWIVGRGHATGWLSSCGLPAIDKRLASIWLALIASGLVLFLAAHWIAFRLYLPSRYSTYAIGLSFQMIIAIAIAAASVALYRGWCSLLGIANRFRHLPVIIVPVIFVVLAITVARSVLREMVHNHAQEVHDFLRASPKGTLVAGTADDIDVVPEFGRRSVLGSLELLIPYKKVYYEEVARRMTEFARALYKEDGEEFASVIARYRIDYVLVERDPALDLQRLRLWSQTFAALRQNVEAIEKGSQPFYRSRIAVCERAGNSRVTLVDAVCLVSGKERAPQ